MSRLNLDVEKLKKTIKSRALEAKSQIEEFKKKAQKAQKDLQHHEFVKKVEAVVELVKSQEFMQDPNVKELKKKIGMLSDELVKELRARIKPLKKKKSKKAAKKSVE